MENEPHMRCAVSAPQAVAPSAMSIEWWDGVPSKEVQKEADHLMAQTTLYLIQFAAKKGLPKGDLRGYRRLALMLARRASLIVDSVELGARRGPSGQGYFYHQSRGWTISTRRISTTLRFSRSVPAVATGDGAAVPTNDDEDGGSTLGSHVCAAFERRTLNQTTGTPQSLEATARAVTEQFSEWALAHGVPIRECIQTSFASIPEDLPRRIRNNLARWKDEKPHCIFVAPATAIYGAFLYVKGRRDPVRFAEDITYIGAHHPEGPFIVAAKCDAPDDGRIEFHRAFAMPLVSAEFTIPAESRIERWLSQVAIAKVQKFCAHLMNLTVVITKPLYGRGLNDNQESFRGRRFDLVVDIFSRGSAQAQIRLGRLCLEFMGVTGPKYFTDKVDFVVGEAGREILVVVDAIDVMDRPTLMHEIESNLEIVLNEWLYGVGRRRRFAPGVFAVIPRCSPFRAALGSRNCLLGSA